VVSGWFFLLNSFTLLSSCSCHGISDFEENTKLFLQTIREKNGRSRQVLSMAKTLHQIHPFCLNIRQDNRDLLLLAHKLCREKRYQTAADVQLVESNKFPVQVDDRFSYRIQCRQEVFGNYSIWCESVVTSSSCTHFLQINCGDCHTTQTIRRNGSVLLRSPLYPVLQPNQICKYNLILEDSQAIGEMLLEELDLEGPVSLSGQKPHCLSSFLQIQSGSSESQLIWSRTLCGRVRNKILKTKGPFIRLLMVSGVGTEGKSGFQIRIKSLHSPSNFKSKVLLFFATFVCVFIGLGSVLACGVCIYRKKLKDRRKRRLRQQHSTWVGPNPVPGQSIHTTRTLRLERMLQASSNTYIMDSSVAPIPQLINNQPNASTASATAEKTTNNDINITRPQLAPSLLVGRSSVRILDTSGDNRPLPSIPYESTNISSNDLEQLEEKAAPSRTGESHIYQSIRQVNLQSDAGGITDQAASTCESDIEAGRAEIYSDYIPVSEILHKPATPLAGGASATEVSSNTPLVASSMAQVELYPEAESSYLELFTSESSVTQYTPGVTNSSSHRDQACSGACNSTTSSTPKHTLHTAKKNRSAEPALQSQLSRTDPKSYGRKSSYSVSFGRHLSTYRYRIASLVWPGGIHSSNRDTDDYGKYPIMNVDEFCSDSDDDVF